MPRRARTYLPGYPYQIVQRGNNRNACFVAPQDYQFYLELWEECSRRYGVAIHAYCLMTNHVHLLVMPGDRDAVSFATKVIGSRYAQYFNKTCKRTGTLWEGRHKSSLVQRERYFLTCSRYIELNPVAANMVSKPEQHKWSSCMCNTWCGEGIVEQHIEYSKPGEEPDSGRHACRELFRDSISSKDMYIIEDAALYNRPLGDFRFSEQSASQYGVVIPGATRGRPRPDGKVIKKYPFFVILTRNAG